MTREQAAAFMQAFVGELPSGEERDFWQQVLQCQPATSVVRGLTQDEEEEVTRLSPRILALSSLAREKLFGKLDGVVCLHCGCEHPNRALGGRCHCQDDD